MSDYPMLISNKLHSFRNFFLQITEEPFDEDSTICKSRSVLQYP